ncbi:INO80 complex subunit C-like [Centruroides sculpturatus]|uniref:INO80 complex subunit C-like n=1 Tax=Centruroides sculpturatus TaxID=218467 RepID=UPI000C6E13B5|nr:INO80 complex subunit C-like [Centruroides sculpturatus]
MVKKKRSNVQSNELSGKGATAGKRTRIWKSLKQIITADRLLPVPARDISYSSIDSPPSTKPSKKYSDLSGLPFKPNSISMFRNIIHWAAV